MLLHHLVSGGGALDESSDESSFSQRSILGRKGAVTRVRVNVEVEEEGEEMMMWLFIIRGEEIWTLISNIIAAHIYVMRFEQCESFKSGILRKY
jgi:hypothetical protein